MNIAGRIEPDATQATTTRGVNRQIDARDEIDFRRSVSGTKVASSAVEPADRVQEQRGRRSTRALQREDVEQQARRRRAGAA